MNIKLINRESTGELILDGRIDSVTSPEAEKIFLQVVERFDKLVLDFGKVEYISSAGLRVLKKTHMAMVKKGGVLEIKNVNKLVMEVFEMTGFAGLLRIV